MAESEKQSKLAVFLLYNTAMTTSTKESVDFGKIIGKYYDTTRGTIHYDSKGNAHIVPARPKGFK